MASSSTSASEATKTDGSSITKPSPIKAKKVTKQGITDRHIQRKSSEDVRFLHFRNLFKTELPVKPAQDVPELGKEADAFAARIRENASESWYPIIEDHQFELDKIKFSQGYPMTLNIYFEAQLRKCLPNDEAVLQRTIMMSVFHQYWVAKSTFDWNVEGQWQLPSDSKIPSETEDMIMMPKPDLAVSFKVESFSIDEDGADPKPPHLLQCFSPDGIDRCFPFLFMEVKKSTTQLEEAEIANLHTASQALYNMYLWMSGAGHSDLFFKHVRVFSMVFDVQDLSVRMHRAVQRSDGKLSFRFVDFLPSQKYTRDRVCLLVNAILKDYAAKELHEMLLAAYKKVISQESQLIQGKRKRAELYEGVGKRACRFDNENPHTGTSFRMESMSPSP